MPEFIVDIAVPVSVQKTFHYLAGEELRSLLSVGARVLVPFGTRRVTGTVVGFPGTAVKEGLKKVIGVLGDRLSPDLMKRRPLDVRLLPASPRPFHRDHGAPGARHSQGQRRFLKLLEGDHDVNMIRGPKQSELLFLLCDRQAIPFDDLGAYSSATLKALVERGMAEIVEKPVEQIPEQPAFVPDQAPELMPEQAEAARFISGKSFLTPIELVRAVSSENLSASL